MGPESPPMVATSLTRWEPSILSRGRLRQMPMLMPTTDTADTMGHTDTPHMDMPDTGDTESVDTVDMGLGTGVTDTDTTGRWPHTHSPVVLSSANIQCLVTLWVLVDNIMSLAGKWESYAKMIIFK